MNTSIQALYKKWLVSLVLIIASLNAFTQAGNLVNNTYVPIINPTFGNVTVTSSETCTGISPLVICLDDFGSLDDVHNSTQTDGATWGWIAGLGSKTTWLQVADNNATGAGNRYPAGSYAGFVVTSGTLLGLASTTTVRVSTYLNGSPTGDESPLMPVANLVKILGSDKARVGFITSQEYNAIRITFNVSGVSVLGSITVNYAEVAKFTAGPGLACNAPTKMNLTTYPVSVTSSVNASGSSLVSLLGGISEIENIISNSQTDFAVVNPSVGVLGNGITIVVKDNVATYPAGTYVGFDIESTTLAELTVAGSIEMQAYNNGSPVGGIVTGASLLVGAQLLSGSNRQTVGFVTFGAVDEVRITFKSGSIAGVSLGVTHVYNAVFRRFCEGSSLICNTLTPMAENNYPVYINAERTGVTGGVLGVNNNVKDAVKVIDGNSGTYAAVQVLAGVLNKVSLSVKKELSNFSLNSFAGFEISNSSTLLTADILSDVRIRTYENGVLRENVDGSSGNILAVTTSLLGGHNSRYVVGIITTLPYNEVTIEFLNTIAGNTGITRVYRFYGQNFCTGTINCNGTYWLNSGPPPTGYPVIINTARTGPTEVACVNVSGTAVNNADAIISPSQNDFATIELGVSAACPVGIAVKDAITTYPKGTIAGFTIENRSSVAQLDLLNSITIQLWDNNELKAFGTGAQFLTLEIIGISIIGGGNTLYNVSIKAPVAFDEIRIIIGGIANILNYNRVYGAFVDTREVGTDGGGSQGLTCLTPQINPATPSPVCSGAGVLLTATPAGATKYEWYKDNVLISGASGQTYNATQSGSYTVKVTAAGYSGLPSNAVVVTVTPIPGTPTITVVGGNPVTFCTGGSVTLSSSAATGNQWYRDNVLIGGASNATYTATQSGSYTVIVTSGGCSSAASNAIAVTVYPIPATPTITVVGGNPVTFCTGGSVTLSSSAASGNQWYRDNVVIGGATNSTYTATQSGFYTVIVTSGGCSSSASNAIVVTVTPLPATPTITIAGGNPVTFCAGGSVTLSSSAATGNQWYRDNVLIAGATNSTYTATQSGSYTVIVTTAGCSSAASNAVSVTANPKPTITGNNNICVGGTSSLTGSGTAATVNAWVSGNIQVATVNNSGVVTGITAGAAVITFTDVNGCQNTYTVNVVNSTVADAPANVVSCGNYILPLLSNGNYYTGPGGTGTPLYAGSVINLSQTLYVYTPPTGSCSAKENSFTITISTCTYPDMNVGLINITIQGNTSTNDRVSAGTTYGNPVAPASTPAGSNPQLIVSADGSYSFTANIAGVYKYHVPVCNSGQSSGCPTEELTITMINPVAVNNVPIVNNDVAMVVAGSAVVVNVKKNDAPSNAGGVLGQPGVITNAANGTAVVNADGTITYTPNNGFIGNDQFVYQVCESPSAICGTAVVKIQVLPSGTTNVIFANDDYNNTTGKVTVNGNVLDNDVAPVGTSLSVAPQNTTIEGKGTFSLTENGNYSFTPNDCFTGTVAIVYTACNIPASAACAGGTLYILVKPALPVISNVPSAAAYACNSAVPAANVSSIQVIDDIPGFVVTVNDEKSYPDPAKTYHYIITRTWVVTDVCGNIASASQVITVKDSIRPVIATMADVNVAPNVADCKYSTATLLPVITENCQVSNVTWVMTGATTAQSPAEGIHYINASNMFNTGTTQVVYTVTDASANSSSATFNVTVGGAAFAATTAITRACNGGNGNIAVNAVNGITPYQYSINGNTFQSSNNFNVPAGNYQITVKDAVGCIVTIAVTITASSPIIVNVSTTNVDCNDPLKKGSITINASGGISPYTYNINGGNYQASNIFDNLNGGQYTVITKDAEGCTVSSIVNVQSGNNITVLNLSANAVDANCNGGKGSITTVATFSGGAGALTTVYKWYRVGSSTVIAVTPHLLEVAAGDYRVDITVTDAGSPCINNYTLLATVKEPLPLSSAISGSTVVTLHQTPEPVIKISAKGGTAPYTFTYSLNNGDARTITAVDTARITQTTQLLGTFNYRLLNVTDAKGCSMDISFASATIVINSGVQEPLDTVPDISPTITILPAIAHGTTLHKLTIIVSEINGIATNGPVTLFVSKDDKIVINWNNAATQIDGIAVENSKWVFDDNVHPAFYRFVTNASIPGFGSSTLGYYFTLTPAQTIGKLQVTATILAGSGNEKRTSNNVDAELIDYFIN